MFGRVLGGMVQLQFIYKPLPKSFALYFPVTCPFTSGDDGFISRTRVLSWNLIGRCHGHRLRSHPCRRLNQDAVLFGFKYLYFQQTKPRRQATTRFEKILNASNVGPDAIARDNQVEFPACEISVTAVAVHSATARVALFRDPRGRPRGFPDTPGANPIALPCCLQLDAGLLTTVSQLVT